MNQDICHACPLAKQKRLRFESHNNVSQNPFDLVHCNIWGPFPVYHIFDISISLQLLMIAHILHGYISS